MLSFFKISFFGNVSWLVIVGRRLFLIYKISIILYLWIWGLFKINMGNFKNLCIN